MFFRNQNFVNVRKMVSSIYYIKSHIRGLGVPHNKNINASYSKKAWIFITSRMNADYELIRINSGWILLLNVFRLRSDFAAK